MLNMSLCPVANEFPFFVSVTSDTAGGKGLKLYPLTDIKVIRTVI